MEPSLQLQALKQKSVCEYRHVWRGQRITSGSNHLSTAVYIRLACQGFLVSASYPRIVLGLQRHASLSRLLTRVQALTIAWTTGPSPQPYLKLLVLYIHLLSAEITRAQYHVKLETEFRTSCMHVSTVSTEPHPHVHTRSIRSLFDIHVPHHQNLSRRQLSPPHPNPKEGLLQPEVLWMLLLLESGHKF